MESRALWGLGAPLPALSAALDGIYVVRTSSKEEKYWKPPPLWNATTV